MVVRLSKQASGAPSVLGRETVGCLCCFPPMKADENPAVNEASADVGSESPARAT